MESFVADSFVRLGALFLLMLAASLWLLAMLVNFRGYGARSRDRILKNADRWRRTGLGIELSDERREQFMKVVQRIVLSALFLATATVAVLSAVALIIKLT